MPGMLSTLMRMAAWLSLMWALQNEVLMVVMEREMDQLVRR
jgi:hypothetical protein